MQNIEHSLSHKKAKGASIMTKTAYKHQLLPLRKNFKADLYDLATQNPAIPILIIETYRSYQHFRHIARIWDLLRNHSAAYEEYNEELFWQGLAGTSDIFKSLHFATPTLYNKYSRKIPPSYALGDALAIAYRILKENEKHTNKLLRILEGN